MLGRSARSYNFNFLILPVAGLLLGSFLLSPLVARATTYLPGATLEPDCAPGSLDCGVLPIGDAHTGVGAPALASPNTGALYLDTAGGIFYSYDGTSWVTVGSGTSITSLNGQTGPSQTFAIGATGTDFNISSSGDVHTFNIPDASALNRGLVTTGTQAFAGDKTFNGALAALGTVSLGSASTVTTITGNSSSTLVLNAVTLDATELNRLDGHDAGLVDTNDAVATAITGTGALGSGSIASGFGAIDTGADNITTTGSLFGNDVDRSTAGVLTFGNTNATSASICNSAGCDTISIGTNADADSITIGNSTIGTTLALTGGATWSIASTGVGSGLSLTAGSNTISGLTNSNLSGTAGITNGNLANSSLTVTAGSGLINGGSVALGGTTTLDIGAGSGISANANDVAINLTTSGTTGSTASNSGLEVSSSGLAMLKGCADNELLKWSDAGGWACAADISGGSPALSTISAAAGTNSINNGDHAQAWNWALTSAAKTAFAFGENTASINGVGSQYILSASTLATSSAAPFKVVAQGNTIIDTSPVGALTIGNADPSATVAITGGTAWSMSTAGALTLASLTRGADTITDFSGNGLAVSANALTINLPAATDALSATTSSGSGLEVLSAGLTLLQGCSDTQILKWNETTDAWACAADDAGSSATLQDVYGTGNTILTTTGRNVAFTLGEVAAPTSFTIENQDTAGVSAEKISSSIASGALTNGLLIEQTGIGTMTNGLQIAETAGTITDGILITGTLGNILNSPSLDITGAGAITGATGVTLSSGDITTTGSIFANDVDRSTAGALTFGNTNATSTSICNSAGCDTITIGTNADADAITIGDTLDALAFASTGFNLTTAGALTGVASIDTIATSATALTFAGAGTISSTTISAITLDSGTTGLVNLGTGNNAKTINLGTGTAGNAINIGTNNTTADTIALGSALDTVTITGNSSSTFVLNAVTLDATELNRLDGHDAALVDTNDAVSTAITGAGALNSGSITSGFGAIDTGADNLTTTGSIFGNDVDRSTAGALTFGNTNATSTSICNSAGCDTITIGTNADADAITIGDTSDALAFASTGLNLTTAGALTGVASIDTIATSATALTFAGAGTISSTTLSDITLDSGTTGIVNLGTGNNAKTVNLGTGTAGNAINIGTNNTTSDTISIGSALDNISITSDQWSVTDAGVLVVASCTGCGGGGATLDSAYTTGNTIGTDSGSNVIINLAEVVTPTEVTINNLDTAATNALQIDNGIASGTLTNGLLLEESGAGTMTNGFHILGSAGAITDAINIEDGAGTIADGLQFTGTFTNLINSTNFVVSNAGNMTLAGTLDVASTIQAGSGNEVLTLATGKIDADALTLTAAVDGGTGTSSGSGLIARTDGIGLLQGCANGDVLRWAESTDTWNCAPLASSTESANDTTALADLPNGAGAIVEVMNEAEPNITPETTSSRIWVTGSIRLGGDGTDDETSTFRVFRDTADDTACDGTQVDGDIVQFTTLSATDDFFMEFNLVDSPATTSAVFYTVCGFTNTATTPNAVTAVELTIQEIPATGADYAELYATNDNSLEAGDVVVLDSSLDVGVQKSTGMSASAVIGVVSTAPAMVIGGIANSTVKAVPVALAGRVPVKVVIENGPIIPGDYLVASSTPGVAMKANGTGSVIGQAMSAYDAEGIGFVLTFVKNFSTSEENLQVEDVTPTVNADGSSNGLSTLIATIQAEAAHDPIAILTTRIGSGTQLITDFMAARVTSIRGYFDEIFTRKIHTDQLCVSKSDGTEVCVTGDQLQNAIGGTVQSIPVSAPAPTPIVEPAVEPVAEPQADVIGGVSPQGEDATAPRPEEPVTELITESITEPTVELTPTPEPTTEPQADVIGGVTAPRPDEPTPVTEPPVIESTPTADSAPASEPVTETSQSSALTANPTSELSSPN